MQDEKPLVGLPEDPSEALMNMAEDAAAQLGEVGAGAKDANYHLLQAGHTAVIGACLMFHDHCVLDVAMQGAKENAQCCEGGWAPR